MLSAEQRKLVKTIFILHAGGLGDLVLLAGFVGALRQSYPGAKVTLACHAPLSAVPKLYPVPPDEILGLDLNPYLWSGPSEDLMGHLRPFVRDVQSRQIDLLVTAEYLPTWLSWFAASAAKPKWAVMTRRLPKPGGLLRCLLSEFDLPDREPQGPVAEQTIVHELERYSELLRFLGAGSLQLLPWTLPKAARRTSTEKLSEWGFAPGEYLVCFPLGVASVPEKRWPSERFLTVLREVRGETALPVLLTGERGQQGELETLARKLEGESSQPVRWFAGGPKDIRMLAGLVASSRAYFGIDTGPAHLAQAYGIPGVAIHGGGAWPAYAPWRPGSVAFVHPLGCFGCHWDCLFGHGLCVEIIATQPVKEALSTVIQDPPPSPETRRLERLPAGFAQLIADASDRYRKAQQDRHRRYESVLELSWARERAVAEAERLQGMVATLEERLSQLEQTCEARLQGLQTASSARDLIEIEAEKRASLLARMAGELQKRDRIIAELSSEITSLRAKASSEGG